MSIHELDIVELTEDIPEHGLRRGEQGAVVFAFSGGAYEVEFVTVTWFESLEAVRAFAGEDYEAAVVSPAARALLTSFDARSRHYETLLTPG